MDDDLRAYMQAAGLFGPPPPDPVSVLEELLAELQRFQVGTEDDELALADDAFLNGLGGDEYKKGNWDKWVMTREDIQTLKKQRAQLLQPPEDEPIRRDDRWKPLPYLEGEFIVSRRQLQLVKPIPTNPANALARLFAASKVSTDPPEDDERLLAMDSMPPIEIALDLKLSATRQQIDYIKGCIAGSNKTRPSDASSLLLEIQNEFESDPAPLPNLLTQAQRSHSPPIFSRTSRVLLDDGAQDPLSRMNSELARFDNLCSSPPGRGLTMNEWNELEGTSSVAFTSPASATSLVTQARIPIWSSSPPKPASPKSISHEIGLSIFHLTFSYFTNHLAFVSHSIEFPVFSRLDEPLMEVDSDNEALDLTKLNPDNEMDELEDDDECALNSIIQNCPSLSAMVASPVACEDENDDYRVPIPNLPPLDFSEASRSITLDDFASDATGPFALKKAQGLKALTIELSWTAWQSQQGNSVWDVASVDDVDVRELKEQAAEWCEKLRVVEEEETIEFEPPSWVDVTGDEFVTSRSAFSSTRSAATRTLSEVELEVGDFQDFDLPPDFNVNDLASPESIQFVNDFPQQEVVAVQEDLSDLDGFEFRDIGDYSSNAPDISDGFQDGQQLETAEVADLDGGVEFNDTFVYPRDDLDAEVTTEDGELQDEISKAFQPLVIQRSDPSAPQPEPRQSNSKPIVTPLPPAAPSKSAPRQSRWSTTSALSSFLQARGQAFPSPTTPKTATPLRVAVLTKVSKAVHPATATSRNSLPCPTPSFMLSSVPTILTPCRLVASHNLLQQRDIYQSLREASLILVDRPPRYEPNPAIIDEEPHLILDGKTCVLFRRLPKLLQTREEAVVTTLQRFSLAYDRILLVLLDDSCVPSGDPITPPVRAALLELNRALEQNSAVVEIVLAESPQDGARIVRLLIEHLRDEFNQEKTVGVFDCWDTRDWLFDDPSLEEEQLLQNSELNTLSASAILAVCTPSAFVTMGKMERKLFSSVCGLSRIDRISDVLSTNLEQSRLTSTSRSPDPEFIDLDLVKEAGLVDDTNSMFEWNEGMRE